MMSDEEYQEAIRVRVVQVHKLAAEKATLERNAAAEVLRKARAEADAAEHTRDYVRDYYKLSPGPTSKGGAS